MTRFDYRPARFGPLTGIALPLATATIVRSLLAVAGAAVIVLATAGLIESRRLDAVDGDLRALGARVQTLAPRAARARHLIAQIAHDRAEFDRILAARRAAIASTNAIARLGNALPERTWLTAVQSTATGTWTIAGRSARVGEIGTTLRTIQGLDAGAKARLVSVSAAGRTGKLLDFVIAWDQP